MLHFKVTSNNSLCYIMRFWPKVNQETLFSHCTNLCKGIHYVIITTQEPTPAVLRFTFARISPSLVSFSQHHERPRSYLPNTETTKASCFFSVASSLSYKHTHTHTVSFHISHAHPLSACRFHSILYTQTKKHYMHTLSLLPLAPRRHLRCSVLFLC